MLAVLLLSCVTKGTHELVEVQLDATRTALSAKNASCYEDVRDRDVRLTARDEALHTLQLRVAERSAGRGAHAVRIARFLVNAPGR